MLKLTEEVFEDMTKDHKREPQYKESLKFLKAKIASMANMVDGIERSLKNGTSQIQPQLSELAELGSNINNWVKRLVTATGNDIHAILEHTDAVAKCEIIQTGNTYQIKFDRLFPHKLKRATKTTDSSGVFDGYLVDLYKKLQTIQADRYKEPVTIIFINHFSSELSMCDYDNLETASFVDAISSKLLIDDGPKWCSMYYDYTMDDTEYSEIIIVPEREFVQIYWLLQQKKAK